MKQYVLTTAAGASVDMSSSTTLWSGGYAGARQYSLYSSGLITLPFTFSLDGVNYTQVRIYSTGFISLGSGTASAGTNNLTSGIPVIAAYWDPMYITGTGENYGCGWNSKVEYKTGGTAPNRYLYVQWTDMELNQYYGNRATFQLRIYENKTVEFFYPSVNSTVQCGWGQGYTLSTSGSIGIGKNATEFVSVTPAGGSATSSTTSANNAVNLASAKINSGTQYTFNYLPNVQMSATPKIIDYGTVSAGSFAQGNVVVSHVGNEGVLTVGSATITGLGASQFSIISTTGPLNAGQSGTIAVRFTPTQNGTHLATLTISSNGLDSGTQQILLSGMAIAPTIAIIPIGDVNTATRMFKKTRTIVGGTLTQSFLVKNVGAGTLVISPSSTITGDNAAHYQITRWPAYPVAANQTDTMSITFSPTQDGGLTSRAVLYNNATNGTQYIDLFGVGVVPAIQLTPGEMLTFDSVAMGVTTCKTVRISNPGTDTLRLTNNYLSSSDGDFSYTPLVGSDTEIAPGTFRDVTVCITPLQKGTRRARLRFTTNIPLTFEDGGSQGGNPDITVVGSQGQQGYPSTPTWIRNDTSSKSVEIWANVVPSDKTIIALGDFSDGIIGTEATATATFTNAGSEVITVEEPFFSGANASEFKATKANFPLDLAPGASINFTVAATPKLRGENTAVMNIANKSEDRQYLQSVNVSIKGLLASSTVNQTSLAYEKLYVGEASSKTITVTNNGDIDQVYTATLVGSGFKLTSEAVSDAVAPGSSAVYTVEFAPTLKGVVSGSLTVKSSHIADMSVSLSGEADEKPVSSVKGGVSMNGFVLSQNSPNPVTGKTSFNFTSPNTSEVRIILADVTGKTVRELASGIYGAGEHTVNVSTNDIASGSYLYILESEGVRLVRQMVIRK